MPDSATPSSSASHSSLATASAAALAGRIFLSTIFILSGVSKLSAPAMTIGYINAVGLPFPTLALALAVLVELAGGVALIAGYRTSMPVVFLPQRSRHGKHCMNRPTFNPASGIISPLCTMAVERPLAIRSRSM